MTSNQVFPLPGVLVLLPLDNFPREEHVFHVEDGDVVIVPIHSHRLQRVGADAQVFLDEAVNFCRRGKNRMKIEPRSLSA